MKNILYVITALAVMTACGGNRNENAGTQHVDVKEVSAPHDHEIENRAHENEDACPDGYETHSGYDEHDHPDDAQYAEAGGVHSHDSEKGSTISNNPNEIVFTSAQAARTDFEVQIINPGRFVEVIPASGQVLAAPGDEVTLIAPVAGIVSFADRQIADGKKVGAGNTLFHISSQNIVAGDALARDATAYRKAKADLERAEKLLEDKIVSQSEYDALKATYEDAKVAYEALAGSASAKGAGVKTPMSGYVTSVAVSEGDYVETGQLLATVSQNRRLILKAEVSQRYMDRLSNLRSANFILPYSDKVWVLDELGGKLLSVSRTVDPKTPLIPITFEFDNNGKIMPGSYADVRLVGAEQDDILSVPITAISEQQGLYYVYVQLDEECYQRREVELGADDGLRVRILSGLEPGERVVTRGAVNLKMASASGAIPHGHEH